MAKAKGATGTPPVAIELLESDHRKVEALFDEYEDEREGDADAKRAIAERICGELTAHAQLEEELFYPWLRENLDADDMEMLEEAYIEHATAKDLIAQIESADAIDAVYDAKVKVLSEYIKHHVKEEENEIFKEVRDMREELDALGQEMHARKAELAEELGLMQESDTEGMRPEERGRAGARRQEQRGSR